MKTKKQKPTVKLYKIKVTPLAAESLGVRSMCTLVETPDITVLFDAGISLVPYRFNMPPHPIEFQTINKLRKTIGEAAEKAHVTTISHYHFDHHTPSFEDWIVNWTDKGETARQIYQDKIVLIKHPKEKINSSQRQRAWMFQKTGGKHAKVLEVADDKIFEYGKTILRFSKAVPHGSEAPILGWVIMAIVEFDCERFMFAPDVQGPMSNYTLELILDAEPTVVMLGGPPFYLEGFRVASTELERSLWNLEQIAKAIPVIILEHHVLREESWKARMEKVFQQASVEGHSIVTAAEYVGKHNFYLESRRRQLFLENPPSQEFEQWRKTLNSKKITRPPI